MAGLSAAWRLSEPGWHDRFESITVYQRGWRLGGKAASSRGRSGRIEEHGLHVWLGSYDNAFAVLRECYAELDRARTDPSAPVQQWDQALIPADNLAMAERWGDDWRLWFGRFTRNDDSPGAPDTTGREVTVVGFARRALQLVLDYAASLQEPALVLSTSPRPPSPVADGLRSAAVAALAALTGPRQGTSATGPVEAVLAAVRRALDHERSPERRRIWQLLSLLTATTRGLLTDCLLTDPTGFRAINDEDFREWILRHGAHPDVVDFPLVRGMYDMVFGYRDGDRHRPAFSAGLAVFLTGVMLFQYRGAVFWKMTAGMGDVVIAPMYQALQRRGVTFEFFHRLDALHLDEHHHAVESVTMGRQVDLADGRTTYEPLTRVGGLPVFPDRPLAEQVVPRSGLDTLESHFGDRDDAERRILRRGVDFDDIVLAVSLGMVDVVARELVEDRAEWREMTGQIGTVATQAFQIWLRPDEPALGWHHPAVTTSGYRPPFDTWASMQQTLWSENWPAAEQPGAVGYFCGPFDAEWPTTATHDDYVRRCRERVTAAAVEHLDRNVGLFLPGAVTEAGFDWGLLCGVDGHRGAEALATQHLTANIDPSDRYVQSLPGTDRYRLRPDESGYDNLVLAGDWTDCGINAGCIEAAVMSGLEAANALLGRSRFHRIRGFWLP
ncbi:FAD-dependent oxidoreductase [Mycolicibacterium flavescens]|nr:FAD-dependent oxidoreductase [Mycolicibacterium flavescens]